jgi:hypothetical protein
VTGDPYPPTCADVFGSEPCCTYVWWPAGFVVEQDPWALAGCNEAIEPACYSEPNYLTPLCRFTGQAFTALENATCIPDGPNHPCGEPGGPGCAGSCSGI